ncbi:MAG: ABC transporter ATP-binding protein [Prolixibacteraceae bacterium]
MIRVEKITKSFGPLQVLKGINLEVPAGKLYSIVGPSGAGKTTLLQIIGTLSQPATGNVFINSKNVSAMNERQLADFRNRQIGFVFQFHYLLPEFSALENVCIPAFIAKTPKKEAEEKAREYLNFLGLSHRLNHKPAELSGGERQRVAVARALINNPSVILADEPSGNLDTKNREDLHELFFTLRDKFNQTLVIVTHDESFAAQSDAIIRMKDGLIEA